MRPMEDKGCLNHAPNLEIHHHNRTTALGKRTPSKWDDAQKWLVNNLSRGQSKSEGPRDSNADDRRLIAPPTTSSEVEVVIEEETKKMVDSVYVRDMGTEMTPLPSQEPSRAATPVRTRSPGSSTPARGFEEQTNVEHHHHHHHHVVITPPASASAPAPQDSKLNPLETRALAWDEAERAKYMARFKREEVKIEAWENHEKRKAEMEMKRMEAKAERMKARAQEKCMNKLASTRRIAEEKRAKAEAVLNEKAAKTCERADCIRRTAHLPSSFSINLPPWYCCW